MKHIIRLFILSLFVIYGVMDIFYPRTTTPINGTVDYRFTEPGFLGDTRHIITIMTRDMRHVAIVVPTEEFYVFYKGQGIAYYAEVDWLTGIPLEWHIINKTDWQPKSFDS